MSSWIMTAVEDADLQQYIRQEPSGEWCEERRGDDCVKAICLGLGEAGAAVIYCVAQTLAERRTLTRLVNAVKRLDTEARLFDGFLRDGYDIGVAPVGLVFQSRPVLYVSTLSCVVGTADDACDDVQSRPQVPRSWQLEDVRTVAEQLLASDAFAPDKWRQHKHIYQQWSDECYEALRKYILDAKPRYYPPTGATITLKTTADAPYLFPWGIDCSTDVSATRELEGVIIWTYHGKQFKAMLDAYNDTVEMAEISKRRQAIIARRNAEDEKRDREQRARDKCQQRIKKAKLQTS